MALIPFGMKRALSPVEHVFPEPHVDERVTGFELRGHIGVKQLEILAYCRLRRFTQGRAFPGSIQVFEINETGGPGKSTEGTRVDVQVDREFRGITDETALVVEVSVVAIDITGQFIVALLDPERQAVRERGINASPQFPFIELDRRGRQYLQDSPDGNGAQRQ